MKPLAKRKADTMSQMVALPKPERASAGFSTFRKPDRPTAMSAMAPVGSGCRIKPTMVATKMANMCQAPGFSPSGIGQNQMATPTKTVNRPF